MTLTNLEIEMKENAVEVNLQFKYSDLLQIDMPRRKIGDFRCHLFPRGTAGEKNKVHIRDYELDYTYVKESTVYKLNYVPQKLRSFCVPGIDYASLWAKEKLLNLSIAEAVQRELNDQKRPGGILNKYGVYK